jgi:hypothetical protein
MRGKVLHVRTTQSHERRHAEPLSARRETGHHPVTTWVSDNVKGECQILNDDLRHMG